MGAKRSGSWEAGTRLELIRSPYAVIHVPTTRGSRTQRGCSRDSCGVTDVVLIHVRVGSRSLDQRTLNAPRLDVMFRPLRTSSPSKSSAALPPSFRDNSRSSIPELTGLSSDEVHFIDTVIDRAGPTATTFLAVLKAYNEILRERGLDSQNEVVYYGKLLKLGTLKGRNWGEKWTAVQQQNGYDGRHASEGSVSTRVTEAPPKVVTRLTAGYSAARRDDDTFTLHSHEDDADTEIASVPDTPRPGAHQRLPPTRPPTNTLGLDTGAPFRVPPRTPATLSSTPKPISRRPQLWESISESGTEEFVVGSSSPTPSSHVAAVRERTAFLHPRTPAAPEHRPKSAPAVAAPTASRLAVAKAREERAGVINEDNAWNKIKMARDEDDADHFRRDRLLERCWSVWRQGFEWAVVR